MKRTVTVLMVLLCACALVSAQEPGNGQAGTTPAPKSDSSAYLSGYLQVGSRFRAIHDVSDSGDEITNAPIVEPAGDQTGNLTFNYSGHGMDVKTIFAAHYLGIGYNQGTVNVNFQSAYRHPDSTFGLCLFSNIVNASGTTSPYWFSTGPDRMWLYYNMLGGNLRMYVAYKGREDRDLESWNDNWTSEWLVSDRIKDEVFAEVFNFDPLAGGAGIQFKYTGFNHWDFGVTFGAEGAIAGYNLTADPNELTHTEKYNLVKGFLLNNSIAGATYTMDNWSAALMVGFSTPYDEDNFEYKNTAAHLYASGTYDFSNNLGLYLEAIAGDIAANQLIYGGVGAYYVNGPLYAWLTFKGRDLLEQTARGFSIEPRLHYTIVPDTLQIRLPVVFGMDFTNSNQTLEITPCLYWNFLRNGLNNDPKKDGELTHITDDVLDTGIMAAYNLGYVFSQQENRCNKNNLMITIQVSF